LGIVRAVPFNLDCHLPELMSIDGGVTPDQAIGAHNASLDGLAGLHDREQ
jgi:hypothetical protein